MGRKEATEAIVIAVVIKLFSSAIEFVFEKLKEKKKKPDGQTCKD